MAKKKNVVKRRAAGSRSLPAVARPDPSDRAAAWTFLSNHAHVLIMLARDATQTIRQVALTVGVTERAVQRIVADLERDGYVERRRIGRKNVYEIDFKRPLRHAIEAHRTIGDLLEILSETT